MQRNDVSGRISRRRANYLPLPRLMHAKLQVFAAVFDGIMTVRRVRRFASRSVKLRKTVHG